MLIGAVLAGASPDEQKIVEETAGALGLSFQIEDDILDVTGTTEVLGKPVGSDEKNHKATYVTFAGLNKAREDADRISKWAIAHMESLPVRNEFLIELMIHLIGREK